jgi:hypothetical protein
MTTDYDGSAPVFVHVVKDDTKITSDKRPIETRVAHRTMVLTANNTYLQVAGYDPARIRIYVNVLDNPIVVCSSISQASDLNNAVTGLAAPNGRILPNGTGEFIIPGPDEVWIAAAAYPARVSFTIIREI